MFSQFLNDKLIKFIFAITVILTTSFTFHSQAQTTAKSRLDGTFDYSEILYQGHQFFGTTTDNLARVVTHAFERYGRPNAYILGQEASGAIIGGLRYGEGVANFHSGANAPVFWQGPSIGFDVGGDGARTMMLIYHLNNLEDIYRRYGGVDGSAYIVGGVGLTVLGRAREQVLIVPIRTGVGGRLGVNIGYLKFRKKPTWNPF